MAAALGAGWTVVLAEDGALHACGRGDSGQLGLNSREHRLQPARVGGAELPGGAPVVLVAAGGRHWAAVLEDGAVLTCGSNLFGQLGHGNAQDRLQPARLGLPVFGGARVVLVACGDYHTLAVTGGGRVYSCGGNSEGQLGHGTTTSTQVFTLVDAAHFEGASIVMAACGSEHSVAATAEGDVFTWGAGHDGCLGHNDEQRRLAPAKLGRWQFGGGKVVLVAAGVGHTVALTEDGVLWVWGDGSWGQLGLGDTNNRLVPTRLGAGEVFGGSLVRMAACGFAHTLVVTVAGSVWAWGEGDGGQLGLNDEQSRLTPMLVGPEHFAGASVATVAGGADHSAAVTEGGALYTWGQGEASYPGSQVPGGLGHADLANRLVPTPVSPRLLGGARVGRCHGLAEEHALAFAMGTHARLGAGTGGAAVGGRRRSRRVQGKAPAGEEEGRGCAYAEMAGELVKQVVEACRWEAGREVGEGVARLMGGGRLGAGP